MVPADQNVRATVTRLSEDQGRQCGVLAVCKVVIDGQAEDTRQWLDRFVGTIAEL
jgi:hypothetical protein